MRKRIPRRRGTTADRELESNACKPIREVHVGAASWHRTDQEIGLGKDETKRSRKNLLEGATRSCSKLASLMKTCAIGHCMNQHSAKKS